MKTLARRMFGSARLDARIYEEVEADTHATTQAVAVMVLASLGAALGAGARDAGSIVALLLVAIASWIVWVLLTLLIGTKLLPEKTTRADFGEVLRTTGFSASPGILRVLAIVPGIGGAVFLVVTVWMLFSFVVAIRQALDYSSSGRALAVCLLGWAIHGILFFGFIRTAM